MNHHQLDARRLLCPMPVIRTQKKVQELSAGDILDVYCSDPGALLDIPAWCRVHGHEVLASSKENDEIIITLRIAGTSAT